MEARRDDLRSGEAELSASRFAGSLATSLRLRADDEEIDPLALVREVFLHPLPAFIADALEDTLGHLRWERLPEGVDSS